MLFGLLGSLVVRIGHGERAVNGLKLRTLLAVLLLEANQPVSVDRLKTALWGDRPPAAATPSLHNMVARLRTLLADEGGDRLRSTPLGYLLKVAEGELDTELFDRSVGNARQALLREDWKSLHQESAAALALWRGVPLAELPDLPQAQAPRQQWLDARLQLLEWRIEAELRLGHVPGLVPELTRLVVEHPLHEVFHAQLMLALDRLGQRSEALETYQRLRRALVEELGIEPGPRVRAAHERVLGGEADTQEPTADTAGPGPGPGALVIAPPAQLPIGHSDFTGRQAELRALGGLLKAPLDDGAPRVAVVSGMGGIGKTALAVHAGHGMKHLFPDGQLYADLRGFGAGPVRDPHDLLAVFLTALSQSAGHEGPAQPIPEHTDDRAALLRTVLAGRRVLLVLDNARDSAQVLPLLPGNNRCAVIVTTRNTLTDLPAGVQLSLAPLDVEEQRALLSRLCGSDRVRQDPDGELRLLAACAGLPLALRIAGARLSARPAWSLSTLAQRLDDSRGRLQALSVGQLAVDASFATSYLALRDSDDALEREAARAFRLLGLWSGHVLGVDAAAALLDRPPGHTADLLELLADAHLLQSSDRLRYGFHDLLGEFAAARALREEPPGIREAACLRLGIWYTVSLETAAAVIGPGSGPKIEDAPAAPVPVFTDPQHAVEWCRQELPVIKEAIHRAAESSRTDLAWRLPVWLLGYAHTYWWTGEWAACLAMALKTAQESDDRLGLAWTLRRLGACHGMAFRTEESIEALEAALALFEGLGDDAGKAALLGNLSLVHSQRDQFDLALAYALQAWELHQRTGDDQNTASTLSALAQAYLWTGDFETAETHFRSLLAICRDLGNLAHVAVTLANLGDALRGLGRRDEALAALDESLSIRRRLGDMSGIADALVITGRVHTHFGQWSQARTCYAHAVEMGRDHNMPHYVKQGRTGLEQLSRR
ncbi:BTAD domain-containing putative transcriptional regulator [Kitasatospora sp. NPDC006697]|uniref:AfsR/SARP family transcriptional regulator n=1 Tax=Kitasatospora sp. NPDC006697 TaxID=3364020 RepID=UPI003689B762